VLFLGRTEKKELLIEVTPVAFRKLLETEPDMARLKRLLQGGEGVILSCVGQRGKMKADAGSNCPNELCKCFDCTCGVDCTCGKSLEVVCEPCEDFKIAAHAGVVFPKYHIFSKVRELSVLEKLSL